MNALIRLRKHFTIISNVIFGVSDRSDRTSFINFQFPSQLDRSQTCAISDFKSSHAPSHPFSCDEFWGVSAWGGNFNHASPFSLFHSKAQWFKKNHFISKHHNYSAMNPMWSNNVLLVRGITQVLHGLEQPCSFLFNFSCCQNSVWTYWIPISLYVKKTL